MITNTRIIMHCTVDRVDVGSVVSDIGIRVISHWREYSQASCEYLRQEPFALTRVNLRREIVYWSFFCCCTYYCLVFVSRVT